VTGPGKRKGDRAEIEARPGLVVEAVSAAGERVREALFSRPHTYTKTYLDAVADLARLEAVAEAARNVAYAGHYRVSNETALLWDALRALDEEQA